MFVEYINSRNNFELTGSGIDSFRSRTKRFYRRWIIIPNKTRYLISSNLINKLYIACTLNFKHYLRLHIPWRNKMSILIARSNIYYTFFKIIISFPLDRQKSLLFDNLKGLKIICVRMYICNSFSLATKDREGKKRRGIQIFWIQAEMKKRRITAKTKPVSAMASVVSSCERKWNNIPLDRAGNFVFAARGCLSSFIPSWTAVWNKGWLIKCRNN